MRMLMFMAVLMIVFGAAYGYFREKIGNRSLVFKAMATGTAVYLGMYGTMHHGGIEGTIVTVGLVCCMVADIVLELTFIKGILVFGVAHLCFLTAYFLLAAPRWYVFVLTVLIYGGALLVFRKDIPGMGELKIPALVYAAILSLMVSASVGLWLNLGSGTSLMVAVGAVCFLISDGVIALRTLRGKKSLAYGAVILVLYYGAVWLFGAAVFMGL